MTETLTREAISAIEARGIDIETALRYGVSSHTPRREHASDQTWIALPFIRNGHVVKRKYRTIGGPKEFYQDAGGPSLCWNEDCLRDRTLGTLPLVITEGELDAIAALQCGYHRTISHPDGAQATPQDRESPKLAWVEDILPLIQDCKEIILATDGDPPGMQLRDDLSVVFGKARCKFVRYPKACKDINEVLVRYGEQAVTTMLAAAEWLSVSGIYLPSMLPPKAQPVPYSTCIAGMDPHYKVRLGELTVITGIPSHGKTTFAVELACRVADAYGWRIAHCPFEQPPQTEAIETIRHWRLRKPFEEATQSEIDAANDWIEKHFVFVYDEPNVERFAKPEDNGLTDVQWLLDKLAAAVIRYGARFILIDPWNEIDHNRFRDETVTEYVGRMIKLFKRFAQTMNVHLVIVAHPAKLQHKFGEEAPVPTLYTISDSAHWANKPDVGITIWRDFKTDMTLARVLKVRFQRKVGRPGDVWLKLNGYTGRFEQGVLPSEV